MGFAKKGVHLATMLLLAHVVSAGCSSRPDGKRDAASDAAVSRDRIAPGRDAPTDQTATDRLPPLLLEDLRAGRRDVIHRAISFVSPDVPELTEPFTADNYPQTLEEWRRIGQKYRLWLKENPDRLDELQRDYPDWCRTYSPFLAPPEETSKEDAW